MKKLACVFAVAVLLAGCGGGDSKAATKTGEFTTEANSQGQKTTAKVTVDADGKITALDLDETYTPEGKEETTKRSLKDEYGMKSISGIGKEWWEQADFLQDFIVKNGVDAVGELDEDGKPKNEDVLAGCTMSVNMYVDATKEAVKAAK